MVKFKNYLNRWQLLAAVFSFFLLVQAVAPFLSQTASAAALSETMVRFDRLKASTPTTGTVCAKSPSAASATETSVKVTFPTGFTVSGTVGNWTVDTSTTTGWPAGGAAWTGISAPTGSGEFVVSGQSVNFVSGNLASASTLYCFNWTNTAALTTSSAANDLTGSVTTQTTGGSASDTGSYATSIVGNDQIAVTASVSSTFSFSLSSNSAALGTLSTSNPVSASAINASVSTNALSGWQMWASDPAGTPGLHSTTASKTIAYSPTAGSSASALSNGTEGYNIGAGNHTGTCNGSTTYDAAFDNTGATSYKGGGLDNTLRTVVTGASTAASCAIPLTVNASISGTTPAASDYAGTINVVAAGAF